MSTLVPLLLFTILIVPPIRSQTSIFEPAEGVIKFLVYFSSRYRATCVGTLVSRQVVITASVCLANARQPLPDTRPITVVASSSYRHSKRGVRIPVVRVFFPKSPEMIADRAHHLQHSAALMQLREPPPDFAGDFYARPLQIDLDALPIFKEECFTVGWNFYTGYPVKNSRFLLQKTMHAEFLTVERKQKCFENHIHFLDVLRNMGYNASLDHAHFICTIDVEKTALPCHGMYGAPLVCRGRLMGIMTAPDGQTQNCTGGSIYHLIASSHMKPFLECFTELYKAESMDFSELGRQEGGYSDEDELEDYYDYALDSSQEDRT